MATYIGNIKITNNDIIKNWWKLNNFSGGEVPQALPMNRITDETGTIDITDENGNYLVE